MVWVELNIGGFYSFFSLSLFLVQIVQGIISDLESQGALPRSNSRVSSLATCCGPRFVLCISAFSLVSEIEYESMVLWFEFQCGVWLLFSMDKISERH